MMIKKKSHFIFYITLSLSLLFSCCNLSAASIASPPPQADRVFQIHVKAHDANTVLFTWNIRPGYFLYRDRIRATQPNETITELAQLHFPKATTQINPLKETIAVYRKHLALPLGIIGLQPGESIINIHYQGCADDGFCYPPETRAIKLTISAEHALTHAEFITPLTPSTPQPITTYDTPFAHHAWPITLLIFIGLGLLLSLTPCVLPMIPVLSGILVGHGKNLSTRKAFLLSLTYVLSMSCTYAAIGAAVTFMGENFQVLLQTPVSITLFSLLFILLALSMFGVYDLTLPTSWQTKLANLSYHQAAGHYLGAAAMGCLSTLILSPCVTAPLIGALAYIAQTGNTLLGTASLFCLGIGMGLPLLLIGASLGRWLPHAGAWMNTVKFMFGLMLLGIAIYLMSRLIPPFISMLLWSCLLSYSGIILGAFRTATSNLMRLTRGIGLLLVTYGLLILFGASQGGTNPLKPLVLTHTHIQPHTTSHVITTLTHAKIALANAKKQHQPVILDFYADWCTACKSIENKTLQAPEIQNALKPIRLLTIDLTSNNHESRALLHHFNVIAPPTFIFIDASGNERSALRLVGHISIKTLLANLHALEPTS